MLSWILNIGYKKIRLHVVVETKSHTSVIANI